jgi:5-methyltetrahydropteroyltriglutamate--homocysteine methyltransferase
VIKGVDGIRIGIHICRGNWSKKDEVLLTGDYGPLLPALKKMKVKQFVLEYATPRAGDIDIVGKELADREIGLGVVNPRTNIPESPEEIVRKAEKALNFYKPEQIFLNTDCGFGTFADRSVNDEVTAFKKLQSIVRASEILKEKYA